ncbi:MAG TPA: DUF4405 domain-containing protein [Candidatus Saccharimonadales bacterium]|nr:DUF4405 domain-containing protein [Candidatus Saccharimonadales bacterium]
MKIARDLAIVTLLLAIYVIAANPGTTGLLVHEWGSIGVLLVGLLHTILHWDWIIDTLKCFLGKLSASSRSNLVIDVALFVAFIFVFVSGFMVSRHVLLALGYFAPGYFVWKPLHLITAKVLLALILVHAAMHWKWILSALRFKWAKPRFIWENRVEKAVPLSGIQREE